MKKTQKKTRKRLKKNEEKRIKIEMIKSDRKIKKMNQNKNRTKYQKPDVFI